MHNFSLLDGRKVYLAEGFAGWQAFFDAEIDLDGRYGAGATAQEALDELLADE